MTFESLESKIVASIDNAKFEQPEFEQNRLGLDKSTLIQGVGGALTGTVEGLLSRFIPMSLPSGVASIGAGILLGKFMGKGLVGELAKGITVGGIASLVSSFIGGKFMQVSKPEVVVPQAQKYEGVIF